MKAMPRAGHDLEACGGQSRAQALAQRGELRVALAGQHHRGHGQLAETIPQRRHRARPDPAQRGGEAGGVVAQVVGARLGGDRGRLAGEQRLLGPAVGEGPEPVALEARGQLVVARTAHGALAGVVDPGRRRDEHEPLDALGCRQRHVERDPPAHRVAAQGEACGRRGEDVGHAVLEGHRPHVARRAMAAQVGREVAFRAQPGADAVPRPVGPAEAVEQHARSGHLLTMPADTHLLLRAFADELVRCGVTHACTSPGSRNTPLLLALAREEGLETSSHIDERAGGFFALGLGKATARPAVLCCTSGTAAAEYLPAVVEAHEAGVPLLVLTADRPPELRAAGAGQAIDQLKLYGDAVRWFFDVGTGHEASPERLRWMRALACRAVWATLGGRPGPVHLNFPFREPLVPDGPLPDAPLGGRPGGAPWLARPAPAPASSAGALDEALAGAERPVVVAGRAESDPGLGAAVARFAQAAGAPLLADPLSGARRGGAAVAHYDALLRVERFGAASRPDLVLRVGDLPTSQPLRGWLASLDAPQLAFAPESVWHAPDGALTTLLAGDPRATLESVAPREAAPDWLAVWRDADARAARVVDELAEGEPAVARALVAGLPAEAALVVASSMPIRDVETFAPVRDDGGPRVLANRGANGIDGTIATALGVAASGAPTVVLLGDVALVHDLGGLASAARLCLPLTVVCLDNGGGGIFDFLPVAGVERDVYEPYVATPPGVDLPAVARALGIAVVEELGWHPDGPALVHVRSDRAENVALHRRVWDAVAAAV